MERKFVIAIAVCVTIVVIVFVVIVALIIRCRKKAARTRQRQRRPPITVSDPFQPCTRQRQRRPYITIPDTFQPYRGMQSSKCTIGAGRDDLELSDVEEKQVKAMCPPTPPVGGVPPPNLPPI